MAIKFCSRTEVALKIEKNLLVCLNEAERENNDER